MTPEQLAQQLFDAHWKARGRTPIPWGQCNDEELAGWLAVAAAALATTAALTADARAQYNARAREARCLQIRTREV